jgi:hypothetical protein
MISASHHCTAIAFHDRPTGCSGFLAYQFVCEDAHQDVGNDKGNAPWAKVLGLRSPPVLISGA